MVEPEAGHFHLEATSVIQQWPSPILVFFVAGSNPKSEQGYQTGVNSQTRLRHFGRGRTVYRQSCCFPICSIETPLERPFQIMPAPIKGQITPSFSIMVDD